MTKPITLNLNVGVMITLIYLIEENGEDWVVYFLMI